MTEQREISRVKKLAILVAKASTPEEFGAFLFAEMNRWKAVLAGKKP